MQKSASITKKDKPHGTVSKSNKIKLSWAVRVRSNLKYGILSKKCWT